MVQAGGRLDTVTVSSGLEQLQAKRRRSVLIVVGCTIIGAAAQVLIKLGVNQLGHTGLIATFFGIFTIPSLFFGYCLYGLFAVLLVYALRHGELSILYPVIALTFVWVSILSAWLFQESMSLTKIAGIAVIVAGVAVLGIGSRH
jgi:multidrug transporter EmrE-like cation transporter